MSYSVERAPAAQLHNLASGLKRHRETIVLAETTAVSHWPPGEKDSNKPNKNG